MPFGKNPKLKSARYLQRVVTQFRRQGKRVVFTNGCFDLLHPGHIYLLEQARAYGDVLIVGINSDRSLRRLKGRERPLLRSNERAYLLAGLKAVDYIVIFSEDTPAELIALLHPDVLVKGGDYEFGEIVGREIVEKVVRVPRLPGISTRQLISRILKRYCPKRGKERTK